MSGWIKLDKGLHESIRFRRVMRALRETDALRSVTEPFHVTVVLGALVRLWSYADSHIGDDNTLDMSIDEIDDLVGIEGFGNALPADWLQVVDSNHVQLPDFLAHNGSSEKQRRDNAKRQAAYRHRQHAGNVTRDVTTSNTRNDARTEERRTEKNRPEKENTAAAQRAANGHAEFQPSADGHLEFEALKALYPKRSGDQRWHEARLAINARLREGHTWEQILDGARRYAAWCQTTGKVGTETVKQAATFCGKGLAFLEPWDAPLTKADVRLGANLSAADEFMRRTEPS